ncbi:MAG: NAD-dependent epimerase/dehydratase family protein [Deltaproteobacteria bacterium]|nr:NAD-dependent epimerase/dehydratase family protein [Deltaproteobacteria bacterium]
MTTLVTGAGGFIGSAVVRRLLERGRAVRAMLMPGEQPTNLSGLDVEIVFADVLDRPAVERAIKGCDVVYHLAALYKLWLPDPRRMYQVNLEGSRNVLAAARQLGVSKVVYTSSIAAIGFREGELADETTEFNQWAEGNDYIRSKWLSEREALAFAADGLPVVVVNPAFPFGPRDRAPTPTGQTIIEVLTGKLPGYPDGGINAVDVDDCAEGHVLAEERGRVGERYILGSHNVTHRELLTRVAEVAGVRAPRLRVPRAVALAAARGFELVARVRRTEPFYTVKAVGFASRQLWFDTSKAKGELGMPTTPLEETIEKSVRWFREHGYV